MGDDKSTGRLMKPDCICRGYVDLLLDISEEHSGKEQEAYDIPNQTGWDQAIQGWGQSPFSCLSFTQQKSKKSRAEFSSSHCVLCTELQDLKLPEQFVPSHAASETSSKIPQERLRNSIPPHLEHRSQSATTCSSSEEDAASDFTLKDRSGKTDLFGSNGPRECTPDRIVPQPIQADSPCLFLKDRNVGKEALLGRVMVLPPVKVPKTPNPSSKGIHILKRRDDSSVRRVIISEKSGVDGDQEKPMVLSCSCSTVGISQGSVTSKHRPTQHQYHLLSQIPISSLAESQHSVSPAPERNLRQEEWIRSPARPKYGYRSHSSLKARTSLRRAEPDLPVLLGTRVQIPVSTQRVL